MNKFIEAGTRLIRVGAIAYVEPFSNGSLKIIFQGEQTLTLSREDAEPFLAALRRTDEVRAEK